MFMCLGFSSVWGRWDVYFCVVSRKHPEWEITSFNASSIAGVRIGDMIYNKILELNMMHLLPILYSITGFFQRFVEPGLKEKFKEHWRSRPVPDVVISFVPFLNNAFCESLPDSIHVTVLTDFTSTEYVKEQEGES